MLKNYKPTIKNFGSFSIQFINSLSNENSGFYGISHLVEHCMFEKVKEFEQELVKYNINYNAITNRNTVVFYISGLDKYVNKFKERFFKAVLEYEVSKETFERERNIIIQEYIQSSSNQNTEFKNNFFRYFFNSYLTLGNIEDIKNIKYEDFLEFKNKYYSIPDYVINVSKYSFKNEEKYKKILNKEVEYKFPDYDDFNPEGYKEKEYESFSTFDDNRCILLFSTFKSYQDETKLEELIYYSVLSDYLGSGLTSPLYKNIREKLQCVYSIGCWVSDTSTDNFLFNIQLKTSNENVDIVKKELNNVIKNLKVNKKRFNDIVKSMKIQFEMSDCRDEFKWEDTKYYKLFHEEFKKQKLSFEKFKFYVNKFINEDIKYCITDLELKEKMKNE
jgi:predicted Zn-dependent peptidase